MEKFRIKELAQARYMTQEDLAQRSGVTLSTVARLWRNKKASEPRASTLLAIAEALGVTIQELYNRPNTADPAPIVGILETNRMGLSTASA